MTAPPWTPEQLEIRDLARDFARGEIRPHAARWDAERAFDDGIFESLAELGFLGMRAPEAHGGLDLELGTYLLVLEELAWGDTGLALSVAVHNGLVTSLLRVRGSEEQKERHLPRLASGTLLGAFALSESEAGSDPSSIRTRAVRDGDGWVLNGEKRWVANGRRAGLVVVFAQTAEEPAGDASPEGSPSARSSSEDSSPEGSSRGSSSTGSSSPRARPSKGSLGAFLVEADSDGYRVGGRERTLGLRGLEVVSLHLEDVRVGADALVGDSGGGLRYALEALNVGRVGVAAQCVGLARSALEHAASYAGEREQFGRTIGRFGGIQEKLAEMAMRVAQARLLTHGAAGLLEASETRGPGPGGSPAGERAGAGGWTGALGVEAPSAACAMAKVAASESAVAVADEAVQIFGGYGYMRDYPVEKLLRDAKGAEIYEGANELLRGVVARDLLLRE